MGRKGEARAAARGAPGGGELFGRGGGRRQAGRGSGAGGGTRRTRQKFRLFPPLEAGLRGIPGAGSLGSGPS